MANPLSTKISLDTSTGKVYGTLKIPPGKGAFPVVLIISGSAPTDRDGNSLVSLRKNDSLRIAYQKSDEKMLCQLAI